MNSELERINRGIRALWQDFAASLPEGAARTGEYKAAGGDRFAGIDIDLPNGTYRVDGSDWLLTIAGRRFTGAAVANARNKWGGAKVIAVPPADRPRRGREQEDDHHGREAKGRAYSGGGIPENGEVKITTATGGNIG